MILDEIASFRRSQLEREILSLPLSEVKKTAEKISTPCKGFGKALKGEGISVIAEVKKASPSKGVIEPDFHPAETASLYEEAGASAVSCLTEEHYFMGSSRYLKVISKRIKIPVLRKDFIIDPYQIYEARVIGADAILLIAAMLDKSTLTEFGKIADSLGLDVLAETHNERELDTVLSAGFKIVGVNNRDLKTFNVSLETSEKLMSMIPAECIKVSESGIKTNDDVKRLRSYGADAVLIGETLMRSGLEGIAHCMRELKEGII